jgi:hypothetical protein
MSVQGQRVTNEQTHCLGVGGASIEPELLAVLEISEFEFPLLSLRIINGHYIVATNVTMDPACTKHKAKGCKRKSVEESERINGHVPHTTDTVA